MLKSADGRAEGLEDRVGWGFEDGGGMDGRAKQSKVGKGKGMEGRAKGMGWVYLGLAFFDRFYIQIQCNTL